MLSVIQNRFSRCVVKYQISYLLFGFYKQEFALETNNISVVFPLRILRFF